MTANLSRSPAAAQASRRLLVSLVVVFALFDVYVAAVLVDMSYRAARQQALANVDHVVRYLAPAIARSVAQGDSAQVDLQVAAARGLPHIALVAVVAKSDLTVKSPQRMAIVRRAALPLPDAPPPFDRGGFLVVGADLSAARASLAKYFWWCVGIGGLGLALLAFIVLFVLDRMLTRPILALDGYARAARVGAVKLPVVTRPRTGAPHSILDALDDLTDAVRGMVRSLQREVAERQAAEQRLCHSERSMADAQRIAHVGSWSWDLTANRLSFSDELYRLYRLKRLTPEPGFERILTMVHEEDAPRVTKDFQELSAGLAARDLEYRIRRADGSVRWIQCRREVRLNERDVPVFVMGIALDITERKRAEEALRRMNDSLETRVAERTQQLHLINQELDAFAFSVSHDLRAPLRTIHSFSNILLQRHAAAMDAPAVRCVENIRQSAVDMVDLIEGLLTLARAAKGDVRRERVDLSEMAARIGEKLSAEEDERDVTLSIAPDLIVHGNRDFLEIALENLLGNAWKYTRFQRQPRIEFGRKNGAALPIFFIRDNGVGFDMRYAQRLFKPFQRLHPPCRFEGNGIGLATVRRIVVRHGGEIWGEGVPDGGATFFFTIPDLSEAGDAMRSGDHAEIAAPHMPLRPSGCINQNETGEIDG